MSRRPTDDRVEQNRATLKSLVKLESNKTCADCKKNKHPRWASWNLGIFVCIRCSGIHRGLGTHISRVKSVDLDSWTDEQTQSMVKWGNARANKYWEAKLAPGHVPSDSKMENFIRTKYESKRWVMDGPMPDPSTLDGDDSSETAPPAVAVERSSSQRQPVSRTQPKPTVDLFGESIAAPARPSTGPPIGTQPPPKAEPAPPKQTKPAESLLGLDFFGSSPTPPAGASNDLGGLASTTGQSKSDLKQSILSLYATAPKPSPQPQAQAASSGFGVLQSGATQSQPSGFGGFDDAFSSLNLGSTAQPAAKPSPFANLTSSFNTKSTTATKQAPPTIAAGGSFFDPAPKSPPAITAQTAKPTATSGFEDLFSSPSPPVQSKPASSLSADLFDLSPSPPSNLPAPSTFTSMTMPSASSTAPSVPSPFNLSSNAKSSATSKPATSPMPGQSLDPWGSSDVWGASETAAPSSTVANTSTTTTSTFPSMDNAWGSTTKSTKPTQTTIAADEDFGGWNSAPAAQPKPAPNSSSGGGFGGNDDLFSNVWQ